MAGKMGIKLRVVAFLCAVATLAACSEPADTDPVSVPITAPVTTIDQPHSPVFCVYQGQNYSVGAVVNFGGPAAAKCAADGTWQGY